MIDLRLRVVYDGTKHEMTQFGTSDVVALERQYGKAAVRLAEIGVDETCFLVWRWLRRHGHIGQDVAFDDAFLDRVEDLEDLGGGTEPAPAPFDGTPSGAP